MPKPVQYLLYFLGWAIVYSFMFFLSHDITANPPGKGDPVLNYYILFPVSIVVWIVTWKMYEKAFSKKESIKGGDNSWTHYYQLKNPLLYYYLMALKLFLLALGANGLIRLLTNQTESTVVWVVNFVVLYLYALPFFIIKTKMHLKASNSTLVVENNEIAIKTKNETVKKIAIMEADEVLIDKDKTGLILKKGDDIIYAGGKSSKVSSFYITGFDNILELVTSKKKNKITEVVSLKDEIKNRKINVYV